jgi:ATP-dependent RNA helicase RhlB
LNQTTFESLPIPEVVLKGIRDADFKYCTSIQEKTLPISLSGKDIAGQAQTGTGKTAAFLITLFTRLLNNPKPKPKRKGWVAPRALVIAPTRELARQIDIDARLIGGHCKLTIMCIYGGMDYEKQRNQIKNGADVLIVTPGRIIDYYKQKLFSLKELEVLVVDEADRMFDMGFILDLRYLFRNCSPYDKRQSMLFSATLNYKVMELAYEHMNNPVKIMVEPGKAVVDDIKQVLYHVGLHEKFNLLLGLLKKESGEKVLIFCNTKMWAERLELLLKHNDYVAALISGDLHQKKRISVLEDFKTGKLNILIATDVASRGIHVDNITHVINYDVPQDPEDYVHRIGRTARAGAKGTAITLCCENYALHLERVEQYLKNKIPVEWAEEELFLPAKEGAPPLKRRTPLKTESRNKPGRSNQRQNSRQSNSKSRRPHSRKNR